MQVFESLMEFIEVYQSINYEKRIKKMRRIK